MGVETETSANTRLAVEGIIYILINEAMPGYTKVGRTTTNVEQRMRELDSTGVPLPFECFYAARVADCNAAERLLHDAFADNRVRSRREFFQISAERVASALRLAAIEDVTPRDDVVEDIDDQVALNKAREKRAAFNFLMVKIKPGSVLTYIDDAAVTCTVVDNRRVHFRDEVTSLSQAALTLLHEKGYTWRTCAGPQYWEYEGRTLSDIRNAMEAGED